MTIKIKYSLEDTEKSYNSFEEIQQLEDYNDIVYIYCRINNLTKFPSNLPQSLLELYCDHNKLTTIESKLPDSLQILYCHNTKLTKLPQNLPQSLQKLYCTYNKLTKLPQNLPQSLQELYCTENNLTELPLYLPQSLRKLDCSNNKLIKLPPNLPQSLRMLNCSNNKLTTIGRKLPASLLILNCYNNQLTLIPEKLPQFLQELNCFNNNIITLPPNLPQSLQELKCYSNNLTTIGSKLPASLRMLHCSHNKLITITHKLPQSLRELYCGNNYLTELPPNLPQSLLILNCDYNNLIELPSNLHECRNLTECIYYGNEIEYIPPHITRFINRIRGRRGKTGKVYDDGQNVHNHQIQESIRNSIYAVMKTRPSITTDEMISELVASVVLTEKTKRLLMEYCGQEPQCVHSVIGITFKELLLAVWNIVIIHKNNDEILGIMNTEMDDADCKCFTGKMSRLINCLNGYDSRVSITMADNDQISNIIIIEKEKLEIEGRYTTESHKDNVRNAMEERKYPLDIIEEWSNYIE